MLPLGLIDDMAMRIKRANGARRDDAAGSGGYTPSREGVSMLVKPVPGSEGHLSRTALRVGGILDAARRRLVTIRYDARLPEVAQLLAAQNANLLVVCDHSGLMAGVVTKTDIVRRIGQCHGHTCTLSGAVVMTRDVFCCRSEDMLEDVWAVMKLAGFREVPVVDQRGKAIGIVAARDVLHALFERLGYEEDLLRDYVMGNGYH